MSPEHDPRDVAITAFTEGAPVLVILDDDEQVSGHIAALIKGGFTLLVRTPGGRVERPVLWGRVKDMAIYEDLHGGVLESDDPLDRLSADLKRRAEEGRQQSIAERIVNERQGLDDGRA